MAKADIEKFLNQLKAEFKRTKYYRTQVANRETNTFWFAKSVMKQQLLAEFEFRGVTEILKQKSVEDFVDRELDVIRVALSAAAQEVKAARPESTRIVANASSIKVTLTHEINPRTNKGFDNFTKLKEVYKKGIDKFALDLKEFIRDQYVLTKTTGAQFKGLDENKFPIREVGLTNTEITAGSDLFEGGHDVGVYESRARDALNTVTMTLYPAEADVQALAADLEELGINFVAIRDDFDSTFTFKIESKVLNRQAGAKTQREAEELTRAINEALRKLNATQEIPNLKGSRSIKQLKEDQLLEATLVPFEKIAGKDVVIKTNRKKPKKSKRAGNTSDATKSTKGKSKFPKVGIKKSLGAATSAVARKTPKSNLALDQMAVIANLNARLPAAIINNMGDPALNNRTGRFAASVRVLDIIQTPKGFPSIGYTYLKTPYQTFEIGGKQGDVDLDPRKLIDKTIRELAMEYAMGRIFTRRV